MRRSGHIGRYPGGIGDLVRKGGMRKLQTASAIHLIFNFIIAESAAPVEV
jgi:hypothetical protein